MRGWSGARRDAHETLEDDPEVVARLPLATAAFTVLAGMFLPIAPIMDRRISVNFLVDPQNCDDGQKFPVDAKRFPVRVEKIPCSGE
jgi:hypothetical protein